MLSNVANGTSKCCASRYQNIFLGTETFCQNTRETFNFTIFFVAPCKVFVKQHPGYKPV